MANESADHEPTSTTAGAGGLTVASYSAIADVSDSLITLLRDRITERSDIVSVDRDEVALVAPGELGSDSDIRLALYLYRVSEDGSMKNVDRQYVGQNTSTEPPLSLELEYLLTAFPSQSGRDETTKAADQHRLLGLAMQVLYDHSILEGDRLQGTLTRDDDVGIKISLSQESTHDLTNLWNTFQDRPLQPSAAYRVNPVLIDPVTDEEIKRVEERKTDLEKMSEERDTTDPFAERREKKEENTPGPETFDNPRGDMGD